MSIFYQFLVQAYLFSLLSCNVGDVPQGNSPSPKLNVPTFEGKIMQSIDGGHSWVNIYQDMPSQPDIRSVNVSENRLLIGSEKGALFVNGQLMNKNVWKNENLKEMCVDQSIKDHYFVSGIFNTTSATYAIILHDGLYKKQKGGAHWFPINTPEEIHYINDICEDDNGTVYVACQQGLFYSADNGQHWQKIYHLGWVNSIAVSGSTIIAGCHDGIYSSHDKGNHWARTPLIENPSMMDLSNQNTTYNTKYLGQDIAIIREESRNHIGNAGKIQYSKDGGQTWQLHPADQYVKNLIGVQSIKEYKGKLYCSYQDGLIMSADNGQTWQQVLKYDAHQKNTTLALFIAEGILYCVEVSIGC